jgi:ribosomal protein S18 acetylase RimI-like enzyme
MRIRELTVDDYAEIVSLWDRSALPHKPKGRDSKSAFELQIKKNPNFFLGAYEEDKLVGTVFASFDYRRGWINRLAIDPKYRRSGVAQKLIAAAEKALRKKGAKIISALVEDYNVASLSLFKKCGYVEHRDVVYFSKRDSDEV